MKDKRVEFLDQQIERLQAEKEKRLKKLSDPNYQEITQEYKNIQAALLRLEELGEVVTDILIDGRTYRLESATRLEEM